MPWKKVRTCDHHPLHVDSTYLSKIVFMSIEDICHISFWKFHSSVGWGYKSSQAKQEENMPWDPWDPWPGLVVVKRSAVEVAHAH